MCATVGGVRLKDRSLEQVSTSPKLTKNPTSVDHPIAKVNNLERQVKHYQEMNSDGIGRCCQRR